jgi:hypothetical protein
VSERVYKWACDFGRSGGLSCLFAATEETVKAALAREACFGEVLGKHSDVRVTLQASQFTIMSHEPAVVDFVRVHGPFGRNPLNYLVVACDSCHMGMRVEEEQDYWCGAHSSRICYPCKKRQHADCEVVDYDGQAAK